MSSDALILHLNPMQGAVQTEGDRNFSGLLARIERLVDALPVPVIASGGVVDGINAAKAIALGANLAGIANPVLRATAHGEDEAESLLTEIREELRLTMFATAPFI